MTEPLTPKTGPTDKGRFCPTCGCADIVASELAGGEGSCNVCGWKGKVEELLTFLFSQDLGNPEQVFEAFFLDLRGFLANRDVLVGLGAILQKWGFLDDKIDRKVFARYIGAVSRAIVTAIFETRKSIEKEKHT